MKTSTKIIYFSAFIVGVTAASVIVTIIVNSFNLGILNPANNVKEQEYIMQQSLLDNTNVTYKKEYKFQKVIGWIASFDYQNGKNVFYRNISKFTDISPVFYDLNTDGTTSARSVAGDKDLVNISHKNEVKVVPTIICFDENSLQVMLNDEAKFKAHEDFLITEVDKYNYDGIDIDYESINLTDAEAYMKMLQNLAERLHSENKILSVSVVSKYKDSGYSSLVETRQSQDWNRMGKFVDEIRIMAYDYSPESTPGPVSPISWVESILNYAIDKTDRNKIILGQPLYAYAYGSKRYAYTYDEIDEIIKAQNLTPEFDTASNEKVLKFKKGDEERTMWYQDFETMLKRFYLADKYKVGGISFWRMGGEDERIYNLLGVQ